MHIGIILDGNRRFAKNNKKQFWKGHESGAERVENLLNWCIELKIKELTLYCFSLENFDRSKKEVNFLMDLFKKWFKKLENDKRIIENKVKIKFAGEREKLDKGIQAIMERIEKKTEGYDNHIINFAIAYGGKQEIISAVKKMIKENKSINEKNLQDSLWIKDEPDLIIRTGGEKRMSNFLPWQSTYSEWIFLNKMWPEFTKKDLENAISEFKSRKRRFGK